MKCEKVQADANVVQASKQTISGGECPGSPGHQRLMVSMTLYSESVRRLSTHYRQYRRSTYIHR